MHLRLAVDARVLAAVVAAVQWMRRTDYSISKPQ